MHLECYKLERDAIRKYSPDVPITTNLMGTYIHLDYRSWAKELDVVSWDCYPGPSDPPSRTAFMHDLHRGLRDGQPFMLMEQTPSVANWQLYCTPKRPGILRLWSYLAMAHGADTVMYFQWRRGRGEAEKLHSAVVDHAGRADARVFREVSALGNELARLGDRTLGATTPAQVGVLFDWHNWWAMDATLGPVREKRYTEIVHQHYAAFWQRNISTDIVFSDSDFSRYKLIVTPMLYLLKPGVAERLTEFVRQGGTLVTTYFSGYVNEHDLVFNNGYPGPLAEVLGIWNEELDVMVPEKQNHITLQETGASYTCHRFCAIVHCEGGAVPLATYGDDYYAGTPALTRNQSGQGRAYYLAAEMEADFLYDFYARLLDEQGIKPVLDTPANVEATYRENEQGPLLYVLNYNATTETVALPEGKGYRDVLSGKEVTGNLELEGYDVVILEEM